MKHPIKQLFHRSALLVAIALAARRGAMAQFAINSDGANPNAGLLLAGQSLYGTTAACGASGVGTIFAVNTDGTGFKVLHTFTGASDGANPWSGLILFGKTLYGTTYSGGASGKGAVFAINSDGSGFTNVHSFTGGSDGANPIGGLILTNNTLCGTTQLGGSSGNGALFRISFAPQLSTALVGTNLVLTWSTHYAGFDYSGYTLEPTADLASPSWTKDFPAPITVNGQSTFKALLSGQSQFFRLKQ